MSSTAADDSAGTSPAFLYMGVGGGRVPWGITHLRVHPTVSAIPAEAFRHCENLRDVELPEGLLEIGESAFAYCHSLASINFPEGLLEIGKGAFAHCGSLEIINFPSSLLVICKESFLWCGNLVEIVLSEGLREIGEEAFRRCKSLVKINFPSTLKIISDRAFCGCKGLVEVELPEGLQEIVEGAFIGCEFPCFRIPPHVSEIKYITFCCSSMCSLEVPESLKRLDLGHHRCRKSFVQSLRNVAIPPKCKGRNLSPSVLEETEVGLISAFPSSSKRGVTRALKRRFDGLPIHEKCYYQSYHPTEDVLADVGRIIDSSSTSIDPSAQQSKKKLYHRIFRSRKPRFELDATGKEQDCLGMTPLHILACSTKHDLRCIYYEKYPDNLITRDKWGGIPLLYAFWCRAPQAILQLLIESQISLFPDNVVNWVNVVECLSRAPVPLSCIQSLLETRQWANTNKDINWEEVLVGWAKYDSTSARGHEKVSCATFKYLLRFDISKRLGSLGVKRWRDEIERDINELSLSAEREKHIRSVYSKLVSYENRKEATSLLELALWKSKINESVLNNPESGQKRAMIDLSTHRNQCHINSGAEIVVPNVLPYLLPTKPTPVFLSDRDSYVG